MKRAARAVWTVNVLLFVLVLSAMVYYFWTQQTEYKRVTNPAIAQQLVEAKRSDTVLIDLRPKELFDKGHIEGAHNVPLDNGIKDLQNFANKPENKHKRFLLICKEGQRSAVGFEALVIDKHKSVIDLSLGYDAYVKAQNVASPTEPASKTQ